MPAKKIVVALLIILVAVGGFVAGLLLLRDNQDLREEAAVPGGTATVTIEPATGSFDVGDSFTSSIYFNPANVAISGVAVRLRYPYSGSTPEVTVDNITINNALLSSGEWTCPIKDDTQEASEVMIDISCVNQSQSGYVSNQQVKLADINFRVNSEPAADPLTMRFDSAESIITRKSDGSDILLIPSSTGSYSVGGTNTQQPTATPTSGQTQITASPTPSTQLTATPSPTGTIRATVTPTTTVTKGGEELPDAGIGLPTMLGAGFGLIVLLGALVFVF